LVLDRPKHSLGLRFAVRRHEEDERATNLTDDSAVLVTQVGAHLVDCQRCAELRLDDLERTAETVLTFEIRATQVLVDELGLKRRHGTEVRAAVGRLACCACDPPTVRVAPMSWRSREQKVVWA
jgi:hypothetical protein